MRPRSASTSNSGSYFVDRVGESEALTQALQQHRHRMDSGAVDADSLRNVLTFYGEGGVGKTTLSVLLADWATGRTPQVDWGQPPPTRVDAVVRWDMVGSQGGVEPVQRLVQLRSQLGRIRKSWPAFDFAFGALYRSLHPDVELSLSSPGAGSTTLNEVLAGLAGDAAAAAGMVATGGVGAAAFGASRGLASVARSYVRLKMAERSDEFGELGHLIEDCEAASGLSPEQQSELAARVAFMLTQQIDVMAPADRPMVLVFVDHLERLQLSGQHHLGMATLNRLVAALPYTLFVVTGRDSIDWYRNDAPVPVRGESSWPLLSTTPVPDEEPRQHLVGNLSPVDAQRFLDHSFQERGLTAAPGLTAILARDTDGWPLHLDAIVAVAEQRGSADEPLSPADLSGELPRLVDRLLSTLPTDEANAFRTACLLPYFDTGLVAKAGELRQGSVERLVTRNFVLANPDSAYPHRIHDTLRALVREAGSRAAGGWAQADWEHHARLAMTEAEARFEAAQGAGLDRAATESLALGLNVATENAIFADWLVSAIRRAPTIAGLFPLIAAEARADSPPELADTLAFLNALARASQEDVTDELRAVYDRNGPIASSAGLWRAYKLRARGRSGDALAQLEELLEYNDDRPDLYRNQIVTTLRLARRFRDAELRLELLNPSQRENQRVAMRRAHGDYHGPADETYKPVLATKSRRFQVEQMGNHLIARHRKSGVTLDEAERVLAVATNVGHATAQASALGVLAESHCMDEELFSRYIGQLAERSARRRVPFRSWPSALALRAWAIGDDSLARQSWELASQSNRQSSSWISTEILLEHLGHPLEPVPTQWVEPYPDVRDRWLDLLGRIVVRAGGA